jgi:hypothetical protein
MQTLRFAHCHAAMLRLTYDALHHFMLMPLLLMPPAGSRDALRNIHTDQHQQQQQKQAPQQPEQRQQRQQSHSAGSAAALPQLQQQHLLLLERV